MKTLSLIALISLVSLAGVGSIHPTLAASNNKYKLDDTEIEKLFEQAMEISLKNFITGDTTKKSCEESALLGISHANMYKTDGWIAGGFVGGCLTGGLGCSVVPVFALISNTHPLFYPPNTDRFCYQMAYEKELSKKRARSAMRGGAAGGALFWAAYIALIFSPLFLL